MCVFGDFQSPSNCCRFRFIFSFSLCFFFSLQFFLVLQAGVVYVSVFFCSHTFASSTVIFLLFWFVSHSTAKIIPWFNCVIANQIIRSLNYIVPPGHAQSYAFLFLHLHCFILDFLHLYCLIYHLSSLIIVFLSLFVLEPNHIFINHL